MDLCRVIPEKKGWRGRILGAYLSMLFAVTYKVEENEEEIGDLLADYAC